MEAYNIINRTTSEQLQKKLRKTLGKKCSKQQIICTKKTPGFFYLVPKLYNMLTTDIKHVKTRDYFKTKLMGWIWKNIH